MSVDTERASNLRHCADAVPPGGQNPYKAVVARAELGPIPELAADVTKRWEAGLVTVGYLGGETWQREETERLASDWLEFANLGLRFDVEPSRADIRVSFDEKRGSWSMLGEDAKVTPPEQPTMNLAWLTLKIEEKHRRALVLHEFGHALGCIHEHQRPDSGIRWNRKAVLEYYTNAEGWTEDQVEDAFFDVYDHDISVRSSFDSDSIMIYSIPAEFTTDGYYVEENYELSESDKIYIQALYR